MPVLWFKTVGSRKQSTASAEFERNEDCGVKKTSLTNVSADCKCKEEMDTHGRRFLRFLKTGNIKKSKKQKMDLIADEVSPFEAIRNASEKHSQFAKYLALESSTNLSMTYLPSTVKMSLQWPEEEKSSNSEPEEREILPFQTTESVNTLIGDSEDDRNNNIVVRPPKYGQRIPSATQSDNLSDISTERISKLYSKSEKVYPPTPVVCKSAVALRHPRTPTLGRTALFVRASYTSIDKSAAASNMTLCKQSTERDTSTLNDSQLNNFPNLSSVHSSYLSRSSSINCELRDFSQNPQTSNSQPSMKNDSPSQRDILCHTSRVCHYSTKIPTNTTNRHSCHAYDTVPLDKLECLKLIPSVQMLNKPSETRSISSKTTTVESSRCNSHEFKVVDGVPKSQSHSSGYNYKENGVDINKTERHTDNASTISSSIIQGLLPNNNQLCENFSVLHFESSRSLEVSSPNYDSPSSSKSCNIVLNLRKPVKTPKATVQSIKREPNQKTTSSELPIHAKFQETCKSSTPITLRSSENQMRSYCELNNQSTSLPKQKVKSKRNAYQSSCRQTTESIQQSQNGQHLNISISAGSVRLRRHDKPELENEQHRDVSLRISIQEVKNLSAKGRYFCEICLDRILYARTTSKLSDGTVFWGEQFDLNNLPPISIMTINLFRQGSSFKDKRQRSKSQNQFIAYVTIPLNDESKQCEVQQWFTMQPPQLGPNLNYLESLQGSQQHQLQEQNDTNQSSLMNSVSGRSGRFRKHSTPATCFGYSSAFSGINNSQSSNNKPSNDEAKYTPIEQSKKKTSWTAGISTDINMNKNNKSSPKSSFVTNNTPCHSPNSNSSTTNFILPENSLPQIRMKIHYEVVDILPIVCYDALKEFIKTKYLDLIKSLEVKLSAKQKEELASCLVNIFEKSSDLSVAELLTELLREDINNNGNGSMIFRANSTGSKAMECYIKLVGSDYLKYLLSSTIDQLLVIEDEFEVDPSRLGNTNDTSNASNNRNPLHTILERNRTALLKYVAVIWRRIEASQCKIPRELREVFIALAAAVEETHGVQSAAHLISSCLFLRFICPAIHGPVLFGLASSIPEDNRIPRNLTLIAKVLQNLANLTLFEDKEPHMKSLNSFVEQEIPVMYKFLRSISTTDDSSYQSSPVSDCHEFIELGYEFAKLTQLLNVHVNKISITPRIAELPSLLQDITDALNNHILTSWTHKRTCNCEKYTNNLQNSMACRCGMQRHHSFDVQNPISNAGSRRQSETITTNPPVTNVYEVNRKELPANMKTVQNQQITHTTNNEDSNISSINGNNESGRSSATKEEDSWSSSVLQKDYLPRKFSSSDVKLKRINVNTPENSENMEELMSQYREQLRQLNECIEKVQPNSYHPVSNISRNLSQSTQSVHKTKYHPSEREMITHNAYTPTVNGSTIKNHLINDRIEKDFFKQNISERGHHYHHTRKKITDSKSDNSTPIATGRVLGNNYRLHERSNNPMNVNSLLNNNNNNTNNNSTSEDDINGILIPINSTSINTDQTSTSDSDYNYNDDDRITDCSTENTSECKRKVTAKKNTPRKISSKRQTHLSESPSLDQLAERLQELKKMLQLERQEIEEVVASKTEVIKQQEKSIEQLESELDQLRRECRPSKVKPPNGGKRNSKSTSRTVSPSSSFSSECYPSNLSDVNQACHGYYHQHHQNMNTVVTSNNLSNDNNCNDDDSHHNNHNSVDAMSTTYHSNQGLNTIGRSEAASMENYRTQSFREKLPWHGQTNNRETLVRCDSNSFYLSRGNEGASMSLGHLTETDRSIQMKRHISETKMLPH
ncbi:unnamed protein product [Trichobilharzia szidati]|nr:unnamed protein product [Trichobilharzia szidati]